MIARRTTIQQLALAGAGMALGPDVLLAAAQASGTEAVPFDDIPANFSTKRTGHFTLPGDDVGGSDLRTMAWT